MAKNRIKIYTDGACSGNPGAGGYAAILFEEKKVKVISGGDRLTTNNRMELMAVIKGVERCVELGYEEIFVYSDSAYVVNAIKQSWMKKWRHNGWKTAKGDNVKNIDLWLILDALIKKKKIQLIKVKGHSGDHFNELADKEAKKQCDFYKAK